MEENYDSGCEKCICFHCSDIGCDYCLGDLHHDICCKSKCIYDE